MAANNVLPLPFAIGVGLLVERGMFGVEGAIHVYGPVLGHIKIAAQPLLTTSGLRQSVKG